MKLALFALAIAASEERVITSSISAGIVAGFLLLLGFGWLLQRFAARFRRSQPPSLALALASIAGPGSIVRGSTWSLGWDTPTPGASSARRLVSPNAFGHLGFTGTSVWIDLDRGIHVVLLTNRVHPDKTNVAIREMRPRVHDAVFASVDGQGL